MKGDLMSYTNDLRPGLCTEPVINKEMVRGRGGGYGFQVDDWARLDRFLILGHEGGTFYAGQRELTFETVACIDRLLSVDPEGVVDRITEISCTGRAPKNDPAIFALAYVAAKDNGWGRRRVYTQLTSVCRTGTHLMQFVQYCKELGKGWGAGFKKAVGSWYDRNPLSLAKQVTKYANREGWTHRDILRKCHFSTDDLMLNNVLRYVTQRQQWKSMAMLGTDTTEYLAAVEECKIPNLSDTRRIELIHRHNLLREHMPTSSLNNPAIWEALLERMPLTALLRNLNKMTSVGLIRPLSAASAKVREKLLNADDLKSQRVHPVTVLNALKVYDAGYGIRGSLSWTPEQSVVSALDEAFYLAFDAVEPTNKRYLLGVDVSGSMNARCMGSDFLTCRDAAVVMAMLAIRTEPNSYAMGFGHEFYSLGISRSDSIESALRKAWNNRFHATRCALPIEWAMERNVDVDVFCIYTDNETNRGPHPYDALQRYRDKTGIPAKLAVFGLAQTDFTIADPSDAGMMDFVGFDTAAPQLLADFATR